VAEDFEFVAGDVGFYTDGMNGVCFDNLEVDPLPSKTPVKFRKRNIIPKYL